MTYLSRSKELVTPQNIEKIGRGFSFVGSGSKIIFLGHSNLAVRVTCLYVLMLMYSVCVCACECLKN